VALGAIDSPILLIAGGRDKRLPWEDFARLVVHRVRLLFLIGEAADDVERAVAQERAGASLEGIVRCRTLDEAVGRAARAARSGEVVLLSPACTSYDMFSDYEERGDAFIRAVERLHAA
jgi:UDP-N-acetylmuramoylalanine--D-glutamate ligase